MKRLKTETSTGPDSDVFFHWKQTCLTTVTPLTFQCHFCVSMTGREPTSDCSEEQNTALSWDCGHVHPSCFLCFDKQATVPSPPSLHPCCRLHSQKSQKPQLLLIDRGGDLASNTLLLHLRHKNCKDQVHQEHLQRSVGRFRTCLFKNGKGNNTHPMERAAEKQRGRPSSLRLPTHWTALRGKSRNKNTL